MESETQMFLYDVLGLNPEKNRFKQGHHNNTNIWD